MKLTAKSKLVLLASAAALAFSLGLAPQFIGGSFLKSNSASAAEKSSTTTTVKKKKKTDNMSDSDFDSDTDSNETN